MSLNASALFYTGVERVRDHGESTPSRNGGSKEILAFDGILEDPTSNIPCVSPRNFSLDYACGEFLWYFTGRKDGNFITFFAPSYKNYLQPEGYAHGAYGDRIRYHFSDGDYMLDQLYTVIRRLKKDNNDRQAIIQLWDAKTDLEEDPNILDRPCTLSLQFLRRRERLHMVTTMRSNDAWLGFPIDVFCFTLFQIYLSAQLQVNPGTYYHNVGSFHLYAKDDDKAAKMDFVAGRRPIFPRYFDMDGPQDLALINQVTAFIPNKFVDEENLCKFLKSMRFGEKASFWSVIFAGAALAHIRRRGFSWQSLKDHGILKFFPVSFYSFLETSYAGSNNLGGSGSPG